MLTNLLQKAQVAIILILSSSLTNPVLSFMNTIPIGSDISAGLWHELGYGLGDEGYDDLTGYSVTASAEGTLVAIGSPRYQSTNGDRAGRVRVYQYDGIDNKWKQIGDDIVGDPGDETGTSVKLSISGEYLAVGSPKCSRFVGTDLLKEKGCVRIYEMSYSNLGNGPVGFTQLGGTIVGTEPFDHFGAAVDIHSIYSETDSEEEEVVQVAIGAPGAKNSNQEEVGRVFFVEYPMNGSNTWVDASQDINGGDYVGEGLPGSEFGSSVSLSIDNDRLLVGAPKDSSKGNAAAGRVYLFTRDIVNSGTNGTDSELVWQEVPMGHTTSLWGENNGDQCGTSVSLTLDGFYIAYGCPLASSTDVNTNMLKAGKVLVKKIVYDAPNNQWDAVLIDQAIWGEYAGDESGTAVDLGQDEEDSNKLFLAIGAPKNYPDSTRQEAGHVRVYHLNNDENWIRANLDVDGYAAYDEFGTSVAVSYDGHRVIAGGPGQKGYAKVFQLAYTAAPTYAPTRAPTRVGSNYTEPNGQPSFWAVLLLIVLIVTLSYVVFKAAMYWKNKRAYKVASPRNNDLELQESAVVHVEHDII